MGAIFAEFLGSRLGLAVIGLLAWAASMVYSYESGKKAERIVQQAAMEQAVTAEHEKYVAETWKVADVSATLDNLRASNKIKSKHIDDEVTKNVEKNAKAYGDCKLDVIAVKLWNGDALSSLIQAPTNTPQPDATLPHAGAPD